MISKQKYLTGNISPISNKKGVLRIIFIWEKIDPEKM
jgi:hypothetical protein